MKTYFVRSLMCTGLFCAAVALRGAGTDETTAAPALPAAQEMAVLEHFLELTDADLDQMQQVITRIRAMNPAERAALRREIAKYRQLPPQERQLLRQGWGAMDRQLQDGWRRMMQTASPARRAEIQALMQAAAPEEKAKLRRRLVEEYLAVPEQN
jgi:hypothetical protein